MRLFRKNTGRLDATLNVKGEKKPLVAKFYGDENGKIQIHNQSELDAILKEIEVLLSTKCWK